MPPTNTKSIEVDHPRAIVCPFCALLCDDLEVTAANGGFKVVRNGCARAQARFARPPLAADPTLAGTPATASAAMAHAAKLLKRARSPLIAGLATDVAGMRAAVRLGESCGAVLDHVHGDALAATAKVMQSRGWYMGTLSEIRNRADQVLLFGVDLNDRYENFVARCLRPSSALSGRRLKERVITYVGPPQRAPAIKKQAPVVLGCATEALAGAAYALLATLKGEALRTRTVGGIPRTALQRLADDLRAASYGAVVWAPGQLLAREPTITALCDIVDELNKTTRAVGLSLGGDDGGQTAASTCTWLTGYPLRVAFRNKKILYDPRAHGTAHMLAQGTCDALVWIDAFGDSLPPAAEGVPRIVLGTTAAHFDPVPEVFIPIGTPGLDHDGGMVRTDSVVTLRLRQLRDAQLPSAAAVLSGISELL